MRFVPLSAICEINPRIERDRRPNTDTEVTFVPMAAVDETFGEIKTPQNRPYTEVAKGFTAFRENDVLLAKITPCMENGKAAIARNLKNGLGFGSTEFHVLRAGSDVLPEWLFYYIRQPDFRRRAKATFRGAVGQQRVPAEFLAREQVPVPPLTEQRQIVDILSRAEGIIRLQRQAAEKTCEIIPALFLDMFGDPATNPKGWPIAKLGELLAEPPTLGTMTKPSSIEGRWLDLRVANIQEGQLSLEDKKWVDIPDKQIDRFALRAGDIVLARAIGSLDHLGKAVVVYPDGDWAFDSHLMRVRVDPTRLLPEVFKGFLESNSGRNEFLKHTRRTAVQFNINGKELRAIQLPLPTITLQKDFCARVESVCSVQSQQFTAIAKAESTFAALLAQAYSAR